MSSPLMLGLEDWSSCLILLAYILLFTANSLIVRLSQDSDSSYKYSTGLVVLLIEFAKLVISFLVYLKNHSFDSLVKDLLANKIAFIYYLVPSGFYCVFNNLVFLNLASFDAVTYTVLLQFSIVVTGIIYQYLFQRLLSVTQWISLFVLTAGCIISNLQSADHLVFKMADLLILLQVLCSSFAGVYNEFLLKTYTGKLTFWLQNVVMYTDSCLCCLLFLAATGNLGWGPGGLLPAVADLAHRPLVLALLATNVTGGLVTSIFLRRLNSIVKKFAAAVEMVLLAVAGNLLFGVEIQVKTVVSIMLVSTAIIMYSLYPVTSEQTEPTKNHSTNANA